LGQFSQFRTSAQLCAVIIVLGTALIGLMNPSAGAGELRLEYLSLRGGFTGYVIGSYQPAYFNQADVALAARLPWEKEIGDNWILGTRVLFSAGALFGDHETPGIFTLEPFYALFGRKDGLISIDIGAGGALVTQHKFEHQNFGGAFQFVWTFGATSRFAGPFGAGYHFQHFSDAGMYGSDARGVDMHLFELIYWFDTK
jgi:lipid A 3-O-deacylase PagL